MDPGHHKKYNINGIEYDSIDQIPPEFRAFLEDSDEDGTPDFIQNLMGKEGTETVINTDKQVYTGADQVPEQLKELLASKGIQLDNKPSASQTVSPEGPEVKGTFNFRTVLTLIGGVLLGAFGFWVIQNQEALLELLK